MQVYFCGSIRGGRDDVMIYQRMVQKLQSYGTVLTEHVSHTNISETGEKAALGDKFIHDRDIDWLSQSDVVVAEVTQPSLGVGYELGFCKSMKKKTLCLFRPSSGRSLSAMIAGSDDGDLFTVKHYEEEEINQVLEEFFNKLSK